MFSPHLILSIFAFHSLTHPPKPRPHAHTACPPSYRGAFLVRRVVQGPSLIASSVKLSSRGSALVIYRAAPNALNPVPPVTTLNDTGAGCCPEIQCPSSYHSVTLPSQNVSNEFLYQSCPNSFTMCVNASDSSNSFRVLSLFAALRIPLTDQISVEEQLLTAFLNTTVFNLTVNVNGSLMCSLPVTAGASDICVCVCVCVCVCINL